MPNPQAPNDIRLRRLLDDTLRQPVWPEGYHLRSFTSADAPAVHQLLVDTFDDEVQDFAIWWAKVSEDKEFDPDLVLLVEDSAGQLAGVAICWTSAFLKDLAVAADHRGKGIGEALVWQVFQRCRARRAAHVDLKTNLVLNADAVRLYKRMGMAEVDWEG